MPAGELSGAEYQPPQCVGVGAVFCRQLLHRLLQRKRWQYLAIYQSKQDWKSRGGELQLQLNPPPFHRKYRSTYYRNWPGKLPCNYQSNYPSNPHSWQLCGLMAQSTKFHARAHIELLHYGGR
jgi:hypothetical protein